jgi:hypothetical protein
VYFYNVAADKIDRVTVRLVGIVGRQQGTHDSLCAYYSAAMLLCALRPEFEEQFDAPEVRLDPLYANLPRRPGRTLERSVTDWLTSGVGLSSLCQALNRACAPRTRFRFRKGAVDVGFLHAQIESGLPCILGWESREMGNHTSLVMGFEKFARSKSRWLRLLDPIRAQDTIEFGQLARLATAPLEVVWCERHDGIRPDKLTMARSHGVPIAGKTRLERWDPSTEKWKQLTP